MNVPDHIIELLNWSKEQAWFGRFQVRLLQISNQAYYYFHDVIPTEFIHPDKFKLELWRFLKIEKLLPDSIVNN